MFRFFRKIRRDILAESPLGKGSSGWAQRLGKYILYAIGEIVLVVIGILIALQLNNYSEYRKEREDEKNLLKSLSQEIGWDIMQIENNTKLSKARLKRLDSTLQLLQNVDDLNTSRFIEESFQFVVDQYFKSNSGIFDEAVSSGKMSYIQNESLRQNIFDYYRTAQESDTDRTTRQITDEEITPLFVETLFMNPEGFLSLGIDISDMAHLEPIDLEALKNNRVFWKMVLLKFGSNREQIARWDEIKVLALKLKEQIGSELNIIEN